MSGPTASATFEARVQGVVVHARKYSLSAPFFLNFAVTRICLYHLVALSYFVRRKSCSASRAVRKDLVSFIDHACRRKNFLRIHHPDLDKIVVESDVRMIKVYHVAHALRTSFVQRFLVRQIQTRGTFR